MDKIDDFGRKQARRQPDRPTLDVPALSAPFDLLEPAGLLSAEYSALRSRCRPIHRAAAPTEPRHDELVSVSGRDHSKLA